ncbi:MAG TPA: YggS family pyridoxal phosphate-dependent enzyme [Candidatus Binatia bacterium]|nr:YggS family pyridoxal phosphate-dependent enzyme [Candidatus Binatia bacterium]
MVDVAANYRKIIDRISEAAQKAGRNAQKIKLLGAAKSQSIELVRAAIAAGVRLIGENYVQEAESKRQAISEPIEWHMIGHLQRNKVKAALNTFDLIESLDSAALALELDKEGRKRGKTVRTFVEVNLGDEQSKAGIGRDNVGELVKKVGELSHVRVEGLMAVPPFSEDPEAVRPYFRALRDLQTELQRLQIPNAPVAELSMGMTQDYPVAVEEGATLVRIGTALFGPRKA